MPVKKNGGTSGNIKTGPTKEKKLKPLLFYILALFHFHSQKCSRPMKTAMTCL
jgi:hypothetical protein